MPVAGIGDHHLGLFGHASGRELATGGVDHRLKKMPESGESLLISAAFTIWRSLTAAWAL